MADTTRRLAGPDALRDRSLLTNGVAAPAGVSPDNPQGIHFFLINILLINDTGTWRGGSNGRWPKI